MMGNHKETTLFRVPSENHLVCCVGSIVEATFLDARPSE